MMRMRIGWWLIWRNWHRLDFLLKIRKHWITLLGIVIIGWETGFWLNILLKIITRVGWSSSSPLSSPCYPHQNIIICTPQGQGWPDTYVGDIIPRQLQTDVYWTPTKDIINHDYDHDHQDHHEQHVTISKKQLKRSFWQKPNSQSDEARISNA